MKIVVAVSGGVDSVVLLDELARSTEHDLVVAHFDHGMREESAADARFVKALAKKYNLPFETRREELFGSSEERARNRRYEFLFSVAEKYGGRLATAHHLDDLVETVALNLNRGTRWRGLAVFGNHRVWRPFLKRTKRELIEYATKHNLEWVEDETNRQEIYRRNFFRKKLSSLPYEKKLQIYELWQRQSEIRREVGREIDQADFPILSRYFMIMVGEVAAKEILYSLVLKELGVSLLSSQIDLMWLAIKTGRSGTEWQIGQGVRLRLTVSKWRADKI